MEKQWRQIVVVLWCLGLSCLLCHISDSKDIVDTIGPITWQGKQVKPSIEASKAGDRQIIEYQYQDGGKVVNHGPFVVYDVKGNTKRLLVSGQYFNDEKDGLWFRSFWPWPLKYDLEWWDHGEMRRAESYNREGVRVSAYVVTNGRLLGSEWVLEDKLRVKNGTVVGNEIAVCTIIEVDENQTRTMPCDILGVPCKESQRYLLDSEHGTVTPSSPSKASTNKDD